jgi:hypothetical protein
MQFQISDVSTGKLYQRKKRKTHQSSKTIRYAEGSVKYDTEIHAKEVVAAGQQAARNFGHFERLSCVSPCLSVRRKTKAFMHRDENDAELDQVTQKVRL